MLLFQAEFHAPADMPRQIRLYLEGNEDVGTQKDSDYIEERCHLICEKIPEIDRLINDNTEGWDTSRLGKAELAILRLAVYELRMDDDIPPKVAVDEAVGLAKKYCQENSGGFVNAVLAKIMKLGD